MYRAKMCALHWGNARSGAQNEANVWSGQTFNADRKRFPICRDRRRQALSRRGVVTYVCVCVSGCALFSVCMCNRSSSSSSSTAFKMLLRRQCATFFVSSAGTGETGRVYTYIYNYNSTVRRIEFSPVHFACIFLLQAAFAPIYCTVRYRFCRREAKKRCLFESFATHFVLLSDEETCMLKMYIKQFFFLFLPQ